MPENMILRNVGRYEILVPKGAKLTGTFIVNDVQISEYEDEQIPKENPYETLWKTLVEKERARALGPDDPKGLHMKQVLVTPEMRGLLAGYQVPSGVSDYQLTALANKDGRMMALSTRARLGQEDRALEAVRAVLAAYRPLDEAALAGPHESGWFYSRRGAVITPSTREVGEESVDLTAKFGGGGELDLSAVTVAPSEQGPGAFESIAEAFATWALPLKRHRNESRTVAGLKGVDLIVEEDRELSGLWVARPIKPDPPGPSARVSLELKTVDLKGFLAVWEPVLCSVKRHE